MVKFKGIKFDHGKENLSSALGISDERDEVVRDVLFKMVKKWFPQEHSMKSELLAKICLNEDLSDAEKVYALFGLSRVLEQVALQSSMKSFFEDFAKKLFDSDEDGKSEKK